MGRGVVSRSAASLEVISPQGVRTVVPLGGRPVTLGRSAECDVVIEQPFVSNLHARIEPAGDGFVVKDAGSTNGTWLDGSPVQGAARLANGADLVLGQPGNYRLRFLGRMAADSAAGAKKNLQDVLEISKVLLSTLDLEEVLGRVLDASMRIAQAERGYLFLLEGSDLKLRASRAGGAGDESEQEVEFSRSIALKVAESGRAEFLSDLKGSAPETSASIARLRLQSVACVPLQIQHRVIGIVYLDSHRPAARPDAIEREVVEVLAGLAAVAIENARMIQERVKNERWLAIGRVAASIVHDLRSPLTALRGTAELLHRKISDPEHQGRLKVIIGEADRLSRLAGEMLEFSSEAQPLNCLPLGLTDVVDGFLKTVEPRLETEQIRLARRLEFTGKLLLDRQKMVRMLHNVVGNSLDAMEGGGTLSVESGIRSGRAILSISDTGCGMDAATLASVFEPFFSRGKAHGVGLGMSIVRRIAEQHGATISVASEPGQGTRVEVSFPLAFGPAPLR